MAEYRIRFRESARSEFSKLPAPVKARIGQAIDGLAQQPRPRGAVLMSGRSSPTWRIRVGDYRVLYEVLGDELIVLVVGVGHRRDVYRRRGISEESTTYPVVDRPQVHGGRSWTREVHKKLGIGG
jgi:mRNA interferase RelE/StbE